MLAITTQYCAVRVAERVRGLIGCSRAVEQANPDRGDGRRRRGARGRGGRGRRARAQHARSNRTRRSRSGRRRSPSSAACSCAARPRAVHVRSPSGTARGLRGLPEDLAPADSRRRAGVAKAIGGCQAVADRQRTGTPSSASASSPTTAGRSTPTSSIRRRTWRRARTSRWGAATGGCSRPPARSISTAVSHGGGYVGS